MNYKLFKHNKSMKELIIVLLVILVILFFPLFFKLHFFYNIDKNRGGIQLSLFGFTIIFFRLKLKGLKLVIKNKKQTKEKDIDLKNQDIDFVSCLQEQIIKRIYLKNVVLLSSFGRKENAFLTAMVGGGLQMLFANLKIFICSKKEEVKASLISCVDYEKDKFCLTMKVQVLITVFDVILSIIIAQIKTIQKRRVKRNGKQLSSD